MICFGLLFIMSFRSYNLDHEFCRLTCINSGCFVLFFRLIFFPVLFLNIKLIENCASLTCFNLLYIWSSQSHDPSHEFDNLTHVDSYYFFSLIYMRLSRYYNSDNKINKLIQVDSSCF